MNRRYKAAGFLVIGMAVLSLFSGCGIQRAILYQPDRFPLEYLSRVAAQVGLDIWPAPDDSYRGLLGGANLEAAQGTVIVFHGNAGAAVHRSYYADALVARGYRVVIAEYPGYGARSGSVGEEYFVRDGLDLVSRVREEFGPPVTIWGESLGAGVAAALIPHVGSTVDGVVLITPWDTLHNLVRAKLPFLPLRLIMRDQYDTVANLADWPGPVVVAVAGRDEIIPPRLSRRLYDSLPEPKKLLEFERATHNTWPTNPSLPWWTDVTDFLRSDPPHRR